MASTLVAMASTLDLLCNTLDPEMEYLRRTRFVEGSASSKVRRCITRWVPGAVSHARLLVHAQLDPPAMHRQIRQKFLMSFMEAAERLNVPFVRGHRGRMGALALFPLVKPYIA